MKRLFIPLIALSLLMVPAGALADPLDSPWTGSGSGTTSVVSDGSAAPAELTYDGGSSFSGSWMFQTTATSASTQTMSWNYRGFHSFFRVRVGLVAFVDDGTTVTTTTLVSAGPVNCCSSPSAGFAYNGSHTFTVDAGDTYGFKMTGSHFDRTRRLIGTLVVDTVNVYPECGSATATKDSLWPPNHKFVDVNVEGVTDADGDPVTISIDSIFQDEETDALGDGAFAPDGIINGDTAAVRAERSGTGDGRVYHITYTADDGNGGSCSGDVHVGVPHDKKDTAVDGGALFDSTL